MAEIAFVLEKKPQLCGRLGYFCHVKGLVVVLILVVVRLSLTASGFDFFVTIQSCLHVHRVFNKDSENR